MDPLRLLHDVHVRQYTRALVYRREAAASTCLPIIFRLILNAIPWFPRTTTVPMQLTHQCGRWCW